jgi:hypothetical protein
MGSLLWSVSAGLSALVIVAFLGDRRRRFRQDMDAVGWVDWPTVQMLALIALAVTIGLGFKA